MTLSDLDEYCRSRKWVMLVAPHKERGREVVITADDAEVVISRGTGLDGDEAAGFAYRRLMTGEGT